MPVVNVQRVSLSNLVDQKTTPGQAFYKANSVNFWFQSTVSYNRSSERKNFEKPMTSE